MDQTATVALHVPGTLRAYCEGSSKLSLSAPTVRAVLEYIERRHPSLHVNLCDETGKPRRHLNLFVNADNVRDPQGLDTTLSPGDVVTILPAVSGG